MVQKQTNKPALTCIFPVYNEAKILRRSLLQFIQTWKSQKLPHCEIILVENGSHDNSWHIIKKIQKTYRNIIGIRNKEASYGQAIKTGLMHAKGKIIFIFNVDFFDLDFAKDALTILKETDIVVGSKTLSSSHDERSRTRRLITYFFNVFLRLVLNYPGTDTHGIKALRNSPLLTYSIHRCRTKNELFDTELVIRMTRWGAKLVELPVTVKEIRPSRYSLLKRIYLTLMDLATAFWSKYFHLPYFSEKVVVADDYGLSQTVNQAIINAADKQEIQYVSILANMVNITVAKKLLKRKKIHFSLHFNIIEGKPVAPIKTIPSLVDREGKFYILPIFLLKLLLTQINPSHVEIELEHQYKKLRQLGFSIHHLDSHQHTHAFPPLWGKCIQKSKNLNIDLVRSQDSVRFALQPNWFKYMGYLIFSLALSIRYGVNRSSPRELNEIIVHPGAQY